MRRSLIVFSTVLLLTLAVSVPASGAPPMTRLSGGDRIGTAIAVSQEFWPDGADNVVLARADEFPDALAGGPLANALDAPILLVSPAHPGFVDPAVYAEIERLAPSSVWLLGGQAAISVLTESALTTAGYDVVRIGGADRYETAALIDSAIPSGSDDAAVASGERFPDALVSMNLLPTRILLARRTAFSHHRPGYRYMIIGGTAVLGPEIDELTGGFRFAGSDRYDTAARVLDSSMAQGPSGPLFLATGASAPDALAAGAALAQADGYLLIVDPESGPNDAQAAVLADHAEQFTALYALGGEGALPATVVEQVAGLLEGS